MTGRRIAVIGSGVSGITAGYVLSHTDYVTLFEADEPARRPRRHPHGRAARGSADRRRHRLHRLQRAHLSAAHQAVRRAGGGHPAWRDEHVGPLRRLRPAVRGPARPGRPDPRAAPGPRALPADARRDTAVPPRRAPPAGRATGDDGEQTLGEFLGEGGFSGYFTAHFALPLVAAVWSCPPGTALSYPARYLFAFLANHGMLSVSGSPPWRTVTGGSRCYVERAAKRLHDIRLSTPVRAVRRHSGRRRGARRGGPDAPVRRRGHRHPSGPGAAPARPAHPGRTGRARRVRLHPESGHASHGRHATAGPPGYQGIVELRARRLRPWTARRPGSAIT